MSQDQFLKNNLKPTLSNTRQNLNEILLGTNGRGKSTYMISRACDILEAAAAHGIEKRCLAVLCDDAERKFDSWQTISCDVESLRNFRGFAKVYLSDEKQFAILKEAYTKDENTGIDHQFGGVIIFDDISPILSNRPLNVRAMLTKRRQMNADMFWNFHGLQCDMPKLFFSRITGIVLFQTTDAPEDFISKLGTDKREVFMTLYKSVQAECQKNKYHKQRLALAA